MKKKIKLVLINHSFQINYYSRRWELFAERHPDVDVTLLAPKEFEWYDSKEYTYSGSVKMTSREIDKGNYHRRLINMSQNGWLSDDYKVVFDDIKPDVVYIIGTGVSAIWQILRLRDKYYRGMKVIHFSMRGPTFNLRLDLDGCDFLHKVWRIYQYMLSKKRLSYYNKHIDAVFCHYPEALNCFREEGYNGPIYMQTQVGVNPEWFHPDEKSRKETRSLLGIHPDTYVFGSASRFSPSKGLDDIVNALPLEGDWKYIMMGTGSEEEIKRLKELVISRGLEEKVIMPGMIDWYEIAKYWNAIDCAIHVPRTTKKWVETFSLSAIQPQATQKPVIGSSSGSVPYQLGLEEMIVPEGDIQALHDKIVWVLNHKNEAAEIGKKMYERTINSFSIQHLDDMFYDTIVEDILPGKYDEKKIDMTAYIPKSK